RRPRRWAQILRRQRVPALAISAARPSSLFANSGAERGIAGRREASAGLHPRYADRSDPRRQRSFGAAALEPTCRLIWRPRPELNRGTRFCSALDTVFLSLCSPDGKPARPGENVDFIGVFLDNTRNIVAISLQSVTSRYTDETLTREISRVLGTRSGIAAMAKKLTEGLIKALKPPKHGSSLIWDSEVTGFAIRVFASTRANPQGARTFLLSYWLNGTERRFRIGSWPDWSVIAARAEAKDIRQRVDRGEDPASGRRERREAPTMVDLAERYEREHLPRKSEQSKHDDGVMIGHILKYIGPDRRVADVHHGDIVALHRAITDSGHPVLANRTVACASKLFSLSLKPMAGEDKPWRDPVQGNPCRGGRAQPGAGQGAV